MSGLHLVPCHARGIGATDIAKILGVSVYGKARDVFVRVVEGVEVKKNAAMGRGTREEPRVRARFVLETGAEMMWRDYEKPHIFRHPSERLWFCTCTPDDITKEGVVVDYKTVNIFNKKWKDGPPIDYVLQMQWAMFVTGAESSVLYGAFGRDEEKFTRFDIEYTEAFAFERDESLISEAASAVQLFWANHIETRTEP